MKLLSWDTKPSETDVSEAGLPTPVYDAVEQCWVLDFGKASPGHPIVTAPTKEILDRLLQHVADHQRRERTRRQKLYAACQMEGRN